MSNEDDYFKRIENEKKAALKSKIDTDASAVASAERKATHWHKCGKCGQDMETLAYRGVEIEKCPDCHSVLLDPGELQILAGEESATLGSFFGMFSKS
ncbi:MAG: hypothetical protein GWP91_14495 [Rhodobacterales bacterium]|nr:hypothetical protein [Rhodobacterales bacterium]